MAFTLTYVYTHTHTHTGMHKKTHTNTHTYMHTHTHTSHTHVHMHIQTHMHRHIQTHKHTHTNTHKGTHKHRHTDTYTLLWPEGPMTAQYVFFLFNPAVGEIVGTRGEITIRLLSSVNHLNGTRRERESWRMRVRRARCDIDPLISGGGGTANSFPSNYSSSTPLGELRMERGRYGERESRVKDYPGQAFSLK